MCKEDCLEVKELAIEEDREARASLLLSYGIVSSEENICKEDCLRVKELASKEDVERRNVHREDDEVVVDEMAPDIDGFASTKDTLSHGRKRKM
eukprot:5112866-Ditylum_brightwellii.AAC.1